MGRYLPRYVFSAPLLLLFSVKVARFDDRAMADWNLLAGDELREPPTFHDEMEKRLKMDF